MLRHDNDGCYLWVGGVDFPLKRKCKICKKPAAFITTFNWARCSDVDCGVEIYKLIRAKEAEIREKNKKKEIRKRKEKLNDSDISYWTKKAQVQFNKYIRIRDKDEPCISCGLPPYDRSKLTGGYWQAGHYRSTGAAPELRFEPDNCHKQCPSCNNHKSGNIVDYRINLVKKIGHDRIEWLEGPHKPKRFRVEDLKEIERYWKDQVKNVSRET